MIIKLLQQNAEWLCAIAITIFAGVQCLLAFQQNKQNIKFKRLELANELDKAYNDFLGDKNEAKKIRSWLSANASNFIFLLNEKDRSNYVNFCAFIYNYINSSDNYVIQKDELIKQFNDLLFKLDLALGNANYGLVNEEKESKKNSLKHLTFL